MSTTKLKLVKTDSMFIEAAGAMTEVDGVKWFYLPYWFEKIGDGMYVEHRFEDLPEGLKKHLQQLREQL